MRLSRVILTLAFASVSVTALASARPLAAQPKQPVKTSATQSKNLLTTSAPVPIRASKIIPPTTRIPIKSLPATAQGVSNLSIADNAKKLAEIDRPLKTMNLTQGDIAGFDLSYHFPDEVLSYQTQEIHDPHDVVTVEVLNNILYVMVNPFDFYYLGVKPADSYTIQIKGQKADKTEVVKHFVVNVNFLNAAIKATSKKP